MGKLRQECGAEPGSSWVFLVKHPKTVIFDGGVGWGGAPTAGHLGRGVLGGRLWNLEKGGGGSVGGAQSSPHTGGDWCYWEELGETGREGLRGTGVTGRGTGGGNWCETGAVGGNWKGELRGTGVTGRDWGGGETRVTGRNWCETGVAGEKLGGTGVTGGNWERGTGVTGGNWGYEEGELVLLGGNWGNWCDWGGTGLEMGRKEETEVISGGNEKKTRKNGKKQGNWRFWGKKTQK